MQIAIVGAGAMGSLFGGKLALAGHAVRLIDVWPEHVAAIQNHGLIIESPTGQKLARPLAVTPGNDHEAADFILIFVKGWATAAAAEIAKTLLGDTTAVLTLQNGYGNAQIIADQVGPDRTLVGITAQGATLLGPGRIYHGGSGPTQIGALNGSANACLAEIASVFTLAGLPTTVTGDLTTLIWQKLLVNVGINAVTALIGQPNGALLKQPEARELAARAVLEAAAVAATAGVVLPDSDPVASVLQVAKATAENRSSMLQDLDRGRRTEIDTINGFIVREGRRLGLPVPVNEVLTLLIQLREKLH